MPRFLSNSVQLLIRRAYTAAAGTVKAQEPAAAAAAEAASSVMRKAVLDDASNNQGGKAVLQEAEEKAFWMRDPKTGNWLPETHFNEVDPVELRAKLLSKKAKF